MHILVLGAAGMVGRKLVERLLKDGRLGKTDITKLTLHDVVAPASPEKPGFPVELHAGDFAVPGAAEKLIAGRPDVIFHLAAIVSGEAELDFDKGYRINLDGTRMLLDAIRLVGSGYKPRVVFTSSIAVFGAPYPEKIGDEFLAVRGMHACHVRHVLGRRWTGHQSGDGHPAANVQVLGGGRDRVLDHRAAAGDRDEPLVSFPRRAVFDERGHEREHIESGSARTEQRLGHLRQGRVEDLAPGRVQVVGLAELCDTTPVPLLPRFAG